MHPMPGRALHLVVLSTLVVLSALVVPAGCSDDSQQSSTSEGVASGVVSSDRSLDVSYSDDLIELSFARLDQPFRAMHALVLMWTSGTWTYYGTLHTSNANTVGLLTTEPADALELLDGTNGGRGKDRYRAPRLPAGRYLVCATIIGLPEPATVRDVCGELRVV